MKTDRAQGAGTGAKSPPVEADQALESSETTQPADLPTAEAEVEETKPAGRTMERPDSPDGD